MSTFDATPLFPCFLGPYAENDGLLESLTVEFLRDHVYWRRNLHPEDMPVIPTGANRGRAYLDFEARMRRELHQLSAALKRSIPFHSPRYIGHMVSDLLLPGLAAQMLALPYNPNNVSADAAPVTIRMELQAGLQLAAMVGFPADPADPACAFGHLTSGGTLANVQGLRLALAMKSFPVALLRAGVDIDGLPGDPREAYALPPSAQRALVLAWQDLQASMAPRERRHWRQAVDRERVENLGLAGFHARSGLAIPVVIAPSTAHYSWSKGAKMLGLGRDQLRLVPGRSMRLDLDALSALLDGLARDDTPVLATVGVFGSTEFGTIDPLDRLADLRDACAARGQGFALHADAAWGGYLATLFRDGDGSERSWALVRSEFEAFPSREVHGAVQGLARMDSITIDPHKLGYLPYGAGAFLCRDQRMIGLLAEGADYVFDGAASGDYFERHRNLGRYIPEGSKPGANAAAAYVTHRVLPLDWTHFGRLQAASIHGAEAFLEEASAFIDRIAPLALALVPFQPDSNLVCLAINPRGNTCVRRLNRFMRALHAALSADPGRTLQQGEYFGSITTLRPDAMGAADTARVLAGLGLDADALDADDDEADRLVVLRHTLMNPFLLDEGNGSTYLAGYFAFLERLVAGLVAVPERADA